MSYHAKDKNWMKWRGTWEADRFEGDGSALTGITAGTESDPIFIATSNALSYVSAEKDPIFIATSNALAYVKTESDPIWIATSNAYMPYSASSAIALNTIANPTASKTFNFGNNKSLTFTSVDNTPTAGEGTFNFQATGNFTGDLVHIHQHTGNAGVGTIGLHIEAEDSDILPIQTSGAGTWDIKTLQGIESQTIASAANINIGNATIFTSGGLVGIGTTSPTVGLHLGSAGTGHSLSSATDAIISGKLEVDGETYLDSKLHVYHLFELIRSSGRATHTLYAGTSQEPTYGLDTGTKQLVLTTSDLVTKGFDHGGQTNPTLFIQSATNPDTNNTQWLSLAHDQTNAVFGLGSGAYTFPDGNVGIGTTSPNTLLEVAGTASAAVVLAGGINTGAYSTTLMSASSAYVQDEADPLWTAASNAYLLVTASAAWQGEIGASNAIIASRALWAQGNAMGMAASNAIIASKALWAQGNAMGMAASNAIIASKALWAQGNVIGVAASNSIIASKALWAIGGGTNVQALAASHAQTAHAADTTDPHGAAITQSSMAITTDNDASGAAVVRNILVGVEATPGAASRWPQGTIYMKYTA